jgi:DNA-binding LacI/PurR family transcriptional regulator
MTKTTKPEASAPARKRPATLADVARKAGVVAMTASRAINRSGYVSAEVRERVLKAARQLKYRPNMQARYLKGQRLKAIGIMMPDIANPFGTELVNGMMEVLDNAGYAAFIALAGRGVAQEKAGLQAFVDHRVDGLLVATRGTGRTTRSDCDGRAAGGRCGRGLRNRELLAGSLRRRNALDLAGA